MFREHLHSWARRSRHRASPICKPLVSSTSRLCFDILYFEISSHALCPLMCRRQFRLLPEFLLRCERIQQRDSDGDRWRESSFAILFSVLAMQTLNMFNSLLLTRL